MLITRTKMIEILRAGGMTEEQIRTVFASANIPWPRRGRQKRWVEPLQDEQMFQGEFRFRRLTQHERAEFVDTLIHIYGVYKECLKNFLSPPRSSKIALESASLEEAPFEEETAEESESLQEPPVVEVSIF